MKTFTKDYTTPEQSKRLLELGVPVKSANYKHPLVGACDGTCVLDMDMVINCDYLCDGEIPLWSAGRLLEILAISYGEPIGWIEWCKELPPIQTILAEIEAGVCQNLLDFSKLED